jgi:TRAP-type C4-dicarboxylate transport system permease small subunit
MKKLIDRYCQFLAAVMVLCLAAMVVMVFGNVVMRYGFNSGITLSEELSRWLFVWMTFLGAVVALSERAHLGTDSLIARLPVAGQKLCLGISLVAMLCICGLVFQGAWEQTRINWDSTSAVMEVSMAWFYASGMVFAVLGMPVLLLQLGRLLTGRMAAEELIGIRESDDMPHGNPHP